MMFKLGDKLMDTESYAAAAEWCNQGNLYTIKNRTIVEIEAPTTEELVAEKRQKRDMLLSETDKMMLDDYPITEEKRTDYFQYRQYLRDIPEQPEFPEIAVKTFDEWKGA